MGDLMREGTTDLFDQMLVDESNIVIFTTRGYIAEHHVGCDLVAAITATHRNRWRIKKTIVD